MADLDPIIHQPVRLSVMASLVTLKPGQSMDFTSLRDLLRVTDGNLGGHLQKLEEAGYIAVEKSFVRRKPRTYLAPTSKGRSAFHRHVEALRRILGE